MTAFFVTATGTGVGKTLITAALAYQLRRRGRPVRALKPLISGFDEKGPSDTHDLLAAQSLDTQGLPATDFDAISPWRFKAPLSPDMAAIRENRTVPYDDLLDFCRNAMTKTDQTLLIEGVGGAFVPLDKDHLVADWIGDLGLPSLLVTGSYLGSLSHCLSTVEAMRARNLRINAIVVSESDNSPVPLSETAATLARHLPGMPLVPLPRLEDGTAPAWTRAPDLLNALAL